MYTLVGSDVTKRRNCSIDVDLKGFPRVSLKRGGCKLGHGKSRGCPLPKKLGAVVSQLVQTPKDEEI